MTELWKVAEELNHRRAPFVVVTLIAIRGGAPQELGAKAIITASGLHWGTVGGGRVEAKAIVHARELLERRERAPVMATWNLQRDIGMSCGGEVTFLFEVHRADRWKIVVFGAGHVGQALIRTLIPMRCQVTSIDHRPEWSERLPASERLVRKCVPEPALLVSEFDEETSFVVMTQGHATDVPILEAIFRQHPRAPFIGVMGSDVKAIKMRADLKARGITDDLVARLRCPIGLPFGNNEPAEIAISVAAELIQVRDRATLR